jgi:prepilin-type N-terminal cleavage/methylation domain-containing protein
MTIKNMRSKFFRNDAFSLIELMVALVILGIMTGFAAHYYSNMRADAANTKVKADLMEIKKAFSNFMSDEYNIHSIRPGKLIDLTEKVFRARAIKNSGGAIIKTYPLSADINDILKNDYSDKPDYQTDEIDIKRHFIEKIPLSPWGESYYADLYYVCARNNSTGDIAREPYMTPTLDKFYNGVPAPEFYNIGKSGGASISGKEGRLILSTNDSTNKTAIDALFITSNQPVTTLAMPDKKVTFEFSFKYSQKTLDEPVLNASESRMLEMASGDTYIPCSNGMIYFFKDPPAAGGEAAVMTKSGFGLRFSAIDWELYDSPTGGLARRIVSGGWESSALHSVKFIFQTASKIDCYIDGDLKATAEYATATNISKVYFTVSPDFFTSLKLPPPPYPPLPVLADCEMQLHHISINKVDFSKFYIAKILYR